MGDFYENEEELSQEIETANNSPLDVIYDLRMANERIFYIDSEIDVSIFRLQKQIININLMDNANKIPPEQRKPIKILIDSIGGYLNETMSLAMTIQQSITPVWTINIASAYSGGALLLISGHRRIALPYSKAMIHSGSNEFGGTYEQILEQITKYKREVEEMSKYILDKTSIPPRLYKKNKAKDWYMNDKEQLHYGLVDEITTNLFTLLEE